MRYLKKFSDNILICESMISKNNLKQLSDVMKMSKNTDIGIRTSDLYVGIPNLSKINQLSNIETYEDWIKRVDREFKPSWNTRGEKSADI